MHVPSGLSFHRRSLIRPRTCARPVGSNMERMDRQRRGDTLPGICSVV